VVDLDAVAAVVVGRERQIECDEVTLGRIVLELDILGAPDRRR